MQGKPGLLCARVLPTPSTALPLSVDTGQLTEATPIAPASPSCQVFSHLTALHVNPYQAKPDLVKSQSTFPPLPTHFPAIWFPHLWVPALFILLIPTTPSSPNTHARSLIYSIFASKSLPKIFRAHHGELTRAGKPSWLELFFFFFEQTWSHDLFFYFF